MRIVHICMNGFVDGWGYQENLLTEYQAQRGHSVTVITSANHFPSYVKPHEKAEIISKGNCYLCNGVTVVRIRTYGGTGSISFFAKGLVKRLEQIKPELIFHHDISPTTFPMVARYKRKHPEVIVMADNHADEINCSKNVIWYWLYYKCLSRWACRRCPEVDYYWGVTPLRCTFLNTVFGVNESKIGLLPLGFDSRRISQVSDNKLQLRAKYGIPQNAMVIVTGGKMGQEKGTRILFDVFEALVRECPSYHLVLFGSFSDEGTERQALELPNTSILGWCDRTTTLELLKLSDVAVWPLLHTSLIEDAVACGLPIITKLSGNTSHLLENNGVGLLHADSIELMNALRRVTNEYESFQEAAIEMSGRFGYDNIVNQIENKRLDIISMKNKSNMLKITKLTGGG